MITVKAITSDDNEIQDTWGVYLHGSLAESNGYDLVYIKDIPETDGIYPCKVTGPKLQAPVKATLFFWRTEGDGITRQRGLIVDNKDRKNLNDAEDKFKKRSIWL